MSVCGTPHAYLVMSMMRSRGSLVVESETVCFDRELAIAMAEEDGGWSVWSGVYQLDRDGRCVTGAPIFCIGSLMYEGFPRVGEGGVARSPERPERPAAQRPEPRFVTKATASKGEAN